MTEMGGVLSEQRGLDGKCLLVTGGAGVIGSAVARGLAAAGARVAIADMAADETQKVAASIGPQATGLAVDITDEASVDNCVATAALKMGGLHGLVHCDAFDQPTKFLETDLATWEKTVDVNLTGTFLCCRAVSRHLAKQGAGVLVLLTSATGERPEPGNLTYSASAAGVINLMWSIAIEMAPCGVRANAIVPRPTETHQCFLPQNVLNLPGQPEDVVNAAVFLLSDEASFITGMTLHVDGGISQAGYMVAPLK